MLEHSLMFHFWNIMQACEHDMSLLPPKLPKASDSISFRRRKLCSVFLQRRNTSNHHKGIAKLHHGMQNHTSYQHSTKSQIVFQIVKYIIYPCLVSSFKEAATKLEQSLTTKATLKLTSAQLDFCACPPLAFWRSKVFFKPCRDTTKIYRTFIHWAMSTFFTVRFPTWFLFLGQVSKFRSRTPARHNGSAYIY